MTICRGDNLRDCLMDSLFTDRKNCYDLRTAAIHTQVVNAAFESGETVVVPEKLAVSRMRDGDMYWAMPGLNRAFLAAWKKGENLSLRDFPFLAPAKKISLADYHFFNGPRGMLCGAAKGEGRK